MYHTVKKIVSLVLALAVLAAAVPVGAIGAVVPHRSTSLDTALNVPGGDLHFTTGGDCPFSVEGSGSSAVAASGYEDGYVATALTMAENSSLRFYFHLFFHSWRGPRLDLIVNGELVRSFTCHEETDVFTSYEFIAPVAGEYSIKWLYDGNGDYHFVELDNVEYIPSPGSEELSSALNDGGDVTFITYGCEDFYTETADGRTYARTADAVFKWWRMVLCTTYMDLEEGDTLSFDYYVSSTFPLDYFEFRANDSFVFFVPCHDTDFEWHTFTYTIPASGRYYFNWAIWKGAPTDYSPTHLKLDNVKLVRGAAPEAPSLDDTLNAPGGDLHFEVSGSGTFVTEELFGRRYAVAHGDYVNYSLTTLTTAVHLEKNQIFSFKYQPCASVPGYGMKFYINGRQKLSDYNLNGMYSRCTFLFVAPEEGDYEMKWQVLIPNKEPMGVTFPVQERLSEIQVEPPADTELCEALNAEGGSLEFFSWGYGEGFYAAQDDGRSIAVSDPANYSNVGAQLSTRYLHLKAGQQLSFEYNLADFSSSAHSFGFKVNDDDVMRVSGDSAQQGWISYAYTAEEEGDYLFTWFVNNGTVPIVSASAWIDNVTLIGGEEPPLEPGDVDGDGTLSSLDALLVLRYVLGLVDLTPAQIAAADVNGSGSVDSTDALMILRSVSGLLDQ
jgi:hypothetical protein